MAGYESMVESAMEQAKAEGGNGGGDAVGSLDMGGGADGGAPDAAASAQSDTNAGGSAEDLDAALPAAGSANMASRGAPSGSGSGGNGWQAPPREQWEAMQRQVQMAQSFDPTAIGREFANALNAQKGAAAPSAEDRDYEAYFGPRGNINKFWTDVRADPTAFLRGLDAHAARATRASNEKFTKLEKEYADFRKSVEADLTGLRGHARLSDHRYAESPRWKAHGKTVEKWFEEGRFNAAHPEAIDYAFDLAEKLAKRAGATPAQAAAAGAHAAQAAAGGANPAAAARGAAAAGGRGRPAPHDEPSLRSDKRPTKGTTAEELESAKTKRMRDPQYHEQVVKDALRKAKAAMNT